VEEESLTTKGVEKNKAMGSSKCVGEGVAKDRVMRRGTEDWGKKWLGFVILSLVSMKDHILKQVKVRS